MSEILPEVISTALFQTKGKTVSDFKALIDGTYTMFHLILYWNIKSLSSVLKKTIEERITLVLNSEKDLFVLASHWKATRHESEPRRLIEQKMDILAEIENDVLALIAYWGIADWESLREKAAVGRIVDIVNSLPQKAPILPLSVLRHTDKIPMPLRHIFQRRDM